MILYICLDSFESDSTYVVFHAASIIACSLLINTHHHKEFCKICVTIKNIFGNPSSCFCQMKESMFVFADIAFFLKNNKSTTNRRLGVPEIITYIFCAYHF